MTLKLAMLKGVMLSLMTYQCLMWQINAETEVNVTNFLPTLWKKDECDLMMVSAPSFEGKHCKYDV